MFDELLGQSRTRLAEESCEIASNKPHKSVDEERDAGGENGEEKTREEAA
jgi:hypothetical protein